MGGSLEWFPVEYVNGGHGYVLWFELRTLADFFNRAILSFHTQIKPKFHKQSHKKLVNVTNKGGGGFTPLTIDHNGVFDTFIMTGDFVKLRYFTGGLIALYSKIIGRGSSSNNSPIRARLVQRQMRISLERIWSKYWITILNVWYWSRWLDYHTQ